MKSNNTRKSIFFWIAVTAITLLIAPFSFTQETGLKENAANEFENGNYAGAIAILEQAVYESPDDAELYYYLGYYTHYLCYDSRPLSGYSEAWSDKVIAYLEHALELDPSLGNARYFIGAEYGGRARDAMRVRNVIGMREAIQTGRAKGGYPDWLLEYAKNILRACDPDAILFIGGDAEVNPIYYLQLVENYRKDVTVIPIALLERPWFALLLKLGLEDVLTPAPVSWTEGQILDMHPYKWSTNTIEIQVEKSILNTLVPSEGDTTVTFEVSPNLSHMLSAGRALLFDILETNQWRRPVYFTLGIGPGSTRLFSDNFQLCGLVNKFLPVSTEPAGLTIDPKKIEQILLKPDHFRNYSDVKEHDMPRASIILNNYHSALAYLALHYSKNGELDKVGIILDQMGSNMPPSVFDVMPELKDFKKQLRSKTGR
jgi:tetratricopeptide (TPR) repeat protein